MKVHQFLDHYGITENPFSQEDAQSDQVFQNYCLNGTHHSGWDKVYGDPRSPATSIVFGEQGSGKTAMRLQMIAKLNEFNQQNPNERAFIVEYDDFNQLLDTFREQLSSRQRKPEKTLKNWKLCDHFDCILSLAVTRLCNAIRLDGKDVKADSHSIDPMIFRKLTRLQKRDVMLLASYYDANRALAYRTRWRQLRRRLKFQCWKSASYAWIGFAVTEAVFALVYWLGGTEGKTTFLGHLYGFRTSWWPILAILGGWMPWIWHQSRLSWLAWRTVRPIRIVEHTVNGLRWALSHFQWPELQGQPFPRHSGGDDRYELLGRLQGILKPLGFASIVVLMDRVDEPHLINGNPERMRDFIWPMLDNKFLKHPGMAFKLLLPAAVSGFLSRQDTEFYERSRLDKQNLIPALSWSGQGLFDVANDRLRACAKLTDPNEKKPTLRDLIDPSLSDPELIGILDRLRAPRHLFKYLYRLLVDHCSKYTEEQPQWKIQRETVQSTLALFLRDLEAYDQKRGTG